MAGRPRREPDRESDRYEPLPGFVELPGWVWRRTGRRLRIATGVVLAAAAVAAIPLALEIRESNEQRAEAESRERTERRVRLVRELRAEQRPRFGRFVSAPPTGAPQEDRLRARARQLNDLSAAILGDARRRVRSGELEGSIRRVTCRPFPRTVDGVGAEQDLSRNRGRYSCIAVTAEIERSEASVGALIGHQYRAQIGFGTGRYAYCKIAGQAGPAREQLVTTPRACGGA